MDGGGGRGAPTKPVVKPMAVPKSLSQGLAGAAVQGGAGRQWLAVRVRALFFFFVFDGWRRCRSESE
jgi:hypothetical protein